MKERGRGEMKERGRGERGRGERGRGTHTTIKTTPKRKGHHAFISCVDQQTTNGIIRLIEMTIGTCQIPDGSVCMVQGCNYHIPRWSPLIAPNGEKKNNKPLKK